MAQFQLNGGEEPIPHMSNIEEILTPARLLCAVVHAKHMTEPVWLAANYYAIMEVKDIVSFNQYLRYCHKIGTIIVNIQSTIE